MAKVAVSTIPPEWQPLLDKILAHFQNQMYPTWATRFLHLSRSAKKADKEKTYIPGARSIWNTFTAPQKLAWTNAKFVSYRSGYNVFLGDYSYRKKNGLSLPGTADPTHQIYGLRISNFGGLDLVTLERHDIVATGQLSVHFSYKKVERQTITLEEWADSVATWADATAMWTGVETATWADSNIDWADISARWAYSMAGMFSLHVDAYYFEGGENKIDTYDWEAPAGNVNWNEVSFSFGVTSRYYFHVVCTWSLPYYDADVFFDNFYLRDMYGDVNRETFKPNAKKEWIYQPKVRKQGWLFGPAYLEPWFKVVYLDN